MLGKHPSTHPVHTEDRDRALAPLVEELVAPVVGTDDRLRQQAVACLGHLTGRAHARFNTRLVGLLRSRGDESRRHAADCLGAVGGRRQPP
jgi:hypothetical protein